MPGVKYTITAEAAQATRAFQEFERAAARSYGNVVAANARANQQLENSAKVSARTLKSAIGGLALNATMFAGPQAQAAIYPLMLLQKEYKGLTSAAKLAGISVPAVGLAIAGVTAVIATGVFWWQKYKAELQAFQAETDRLVQQGDIKQRLIGLLNANAGNLKPGEAEGLKRALRAADETQLPGLLRETQDRLRPFITTPANFKAAQDLRDLVGQYFRETLTGYAKEREEAEALYRTEKQRINDARIAGDNAISFEQANAAYRLAEAGHTQRLAEIDRREREEKTKAMLDERQFWAQKERQADEFYRREEEAERRLAEEEAKRQAAAREHQRQMDIENVRGNFRLTDAEKFSQLSALGESNLGPDPRSYVQNLQAAFATLRTEFGTTAQQVAQGFTSIIGGAVNSISDGITGLIMGTRSWAQALAQIGMSILTNIVSAIVQMGVRWIATQILMATVGKSIAASAVATTMPIAAAQAAVWSTPAALATIASYGGAAAAAPGLIGLAQGIVKAQALAGFEAGGFTGTGRNNEAAGIVHRNEWVMPAETVRAWGPAAMASIQRGPAAGGGAARTEVNIQPLVDPRRLTEAQRDHIEAIVVDIFARERSRYRV